MRISEHWLRTWINPPVSLSDIGECLTQAGFEVESILPITPPFEKIKVGFITECIAHPQANNLQIATVEIGREKPLQIVCGATNCRAGIWVACAEIGAKLPGPFQIEARKLRGILSEGMLCSKAELGLEADLDENGILELSSQFEVGTDLAVALSELDYVLDLSIPPNRGDCLSLLGIARELSLFFPKEKFTPEKGSSDLPQKIDEQALKTKQHQVQASHRAPFYATSRLENVDASKPTPPWIQKVLRAAGLQPIHCIVDILNFVMLEQGQPLHGFDLEGIKGVLQIREAFEGESLPLLNGTQALLSNQDCVIADEVGPLVLAGVMGGERAKLTIQSKIILIEAAYFEPNSLSQMARRHHLLTESAQRFERGTDIDRTAVALNRAIELILLYCGGHVQASQVSSFHKPQSIQIQFRPEQVTSFLGLSIDKKTLQAWFEKLGCSVRLQDVWSVTPPSWRSDLSHERDLLEEIARLFGFQNIQGTRPSALLDGRVQASASIQKQNQAKQILASLGFHEAITFGFVNSSKQALLFPDINCLSLPNPLTSTLSSMRHSLLPGLLEATQYNQARQAEKIRIFELGRVFRFNSQTNEVEEPLHLSALMCVLEPLHHWDQTRAAPEDFFSMKAICFAFIERLLDLETATSCSFSANAPDYFHPGRSASIQCLGKNLGHIGQLHPKLVKQLELQGSVYAFELNWMTLLSLVKRIQLTQPSKFPSTTRDLCLTLTNPYLSWESLYSTAKDVFAQDSDVKTEIQLRDRYTAPNGELSVTLRIQFEPMTHTLKEQEIQFRIKTLLEVLSTHCSASLRI